LRTQTMSLNETRLLDMMERGKIHFQDVVETRVLEANIRKDWMKFGAQMVVTVTALAFSLIMTATHPGSEGIYIPIMTGILGYWLPSPEVPKSSAWSVTNAAAEPPAEPPIEPPAEPPIEPPAEPPAGSKEKGRKRGARAAVDASERGV
jgi:hypothetical protein